MRFSLQSGTAAGLKQAPPPLSQMSAALLEAQDWSSLDFETQAIGLTLGLQEETRPWHEYLASQEPVRALELALRAVAYSLRFARAGDSITRVLEATGPTSTGTLPSAEFWRELRRTTQHSTGLLAELRTVAARHAPTDVRLRAGLAYVLPDDGWWTDADRAAALRVSDADTGALMLLALMSHDASSLRHVVWPPPIYALKSLDRDEVSAAHRWCRSVPAGLIGKTESPQALTQALQRVSRPDSLALLARLIPTKELVNRLRRPAPRADGLQLLVRRALSNSWQRALQQPGTLPGLEYRDGGGPAGEPMVAGLRGALRARDQVALDDFARRVTAESLANFAEDLFVQWLLDEAPASGRWALEATGRFPSDAGAEAVAELARNRLNDHVLAETLANMGTHRALTRLAELAHAPECAAARRSNTAQLEKAAARQNLSVHELEDRLFPPLVLPPGATVRVDRELHVLLERDGASLPLNADWEVAAAALPGAVRRLERLMCEGPPLPAIAFTETWRMHPLLKEVARDLVWGVFLRDTRVGLVFAGGDSPPELNDSMRVRPLHPVELTAVERHELGLRGLRPPFLQLDRPCFQENELATSDFSPDEFTRLTESLEDDGWDRDQGLDAWMRSGDGWSARISFREFNLDWELRIIQSEFSISGSPPERVVSELHRELTDAAALANACTDRIVAHLA